MDKMEKLEWVAASAGMLGALLLALNNNFSGFGFVAFLLSNFLWMAWGVKKRARGLLTMQVGFTATSVMGIANWLF